MKIEVSRHAAHEAADALALRVRWYERRCQDPPEETLLALRQFCIALGLDEERLIADGVDWKAFWRES